jgi:hypothetical protein
MSENCGMHFLLKPIRPKNDRICFFVTGTGNCRMAETLNKVKWSDTTQKAFDKLKDCICSDPVLRSPDFSKKFILQTDASGKGMGAVLEQEFDDGRHPI